MLIPRASVSVAKTARMRPAVNSSSTISRKVGSMPAWWAAKPRESPRRSPSSRGLPRSSSAMPWTRSSTSRRFARPLGIGDEAHPGASSWPTAASHPARLKMNVMAGSRPSRSRRSMTSARVAPPPGRPPRANPRPASPVPRPARPPRRPRPLQSSARPFPARCLCRSGDLATGCGRRRAQCESQAPRPSAPRIACRRSGLTLSSGAAAGLPRCVPSPRRRGRRAPGRPSCAATAARAGARRR